MESSKEVGPWRERIALAAHNAMQGQALIPRTKAVAVDICFFMPRPASLPKKTLYMVKRPDIDKLGRACLDAITDVCIEDDSQVVDLWLHKKYSNEHVEPGANIRIDQMVFA